MQKSRAERSKAELRDKRENEKKEGRKFIKNS
jgi:hypothetical protein